MIDPRLQLRALSALGLLVVAFCALVGRLWFVQVDVGAPWAERGDQQHETGARTLPAERGAITDRHGRVLARTEERPSLAIDPKVAREGRHVDVLAEIVRDELGVDLHALIADAGPRVQFRWVRRKVADGDAVQRAVARARAAGAAGLVVQHESVRAYPAGRMASHVVGFAYEDPRHGLQGAEGAERLADSRLRGRDGTVACQRDVRGRWIVRSNAELVPPVAGENVRLTIDSVIQAFAEEQADRVYTEFEPRSAMVAVVDVRTGDLLAAANRPTFDPADRNAPPEVRRNRVFTDTFEPGSTFKPIAMALAMDAGVLHADEVIDTSPGTITIGRRPIREDEYHDYGELTPAGILAESSNVGMAKIGLRIGIPRMHAGIRLFGFGAFSGIAGRERGWSGESRGQITRLSEWTDAYTLTSVSFGQEIAVSTAQLVAAYGALGNDGLLQPLRVFADGPRRTPLRVIRPETARSVVPMLEEVFRSGTASRTDTGGYRLGGKTGTAEQIQPGRPTEYVGSFGCIGPVEAPRLAVVVVCDRPQNGKPYGSRVAAPHAVALMQSSLRYLGVAPRPHPLDVADADALLEVNPR